MNRFDVEALRLKEPLCSDPQPKTIIKQQNKRYHEMDTWFIAPISGPWIAEAAKLPGHALHVALAIMYVHGMKQGQEVILTRYHFDRFHTARGPARRGLDALQQAGLIQYTKDGHTASTIFS